MISSSLLLFVDVEVRRKPLSFWGINGFYSKSKTKVTNNDQLLFDNFSILAVKISGGREGEREAGNEKSLTLYL